MSPSHIFSFFRLPKLYTQCTRRMREACSRLARQSQHKFFRFGFLGSNEHPQRDVEIKFCSFSTTISFALSSQLVQTIANVNIAQQMHSIECSDLSSICRRRTMRVYTNPFCLQLENQQIQLHTHSLVLSLFRSLISFFFCFFSIFVFTICTECPRTTAVDARECTSGGDC